jgi:hypothetical protein
VQTKASIGRGADRRLLVIYAKLFPRAVRFPRVDSSISFRRFLAIVRACQPVIENAFVTFRADDCTMVSSGTTATTVSGYR